MDKKLFAIAGLPRSGSTLIMSILSQNPEITVGPDSSLPEMINASRIFLRDHVCQSQLPHKTFEKLGLQFCRSGAESWVNQICPTNFFVDKNRFWFHHYGFNFKVFPELKIIVCIRDLRFMVESFLKRLNLSLAVDLRNNVYLDLKRNLLQVQIDGIFNEFYVRDSLTSLKEVNEVNMRFQSQLYLLRYEDLIENKQKELDKIYDFLEIDRFTHDLSNIKQVEPHYDNMYQPFGDHNIQSKIPDKYTPRAEYLTLQGAEYIIEEYKWFFEMFYPGALTSQG